MASELAEKIADAVDLVIAENGENTCVYCGEVSFKGFTVENGRWTSVAQEAMTTHVLNCPKRPEAALTAILVDARKYAQMALVSFNAGDTRTMATTLADLINVLTPQLKAEDQGVGDK